jgi:hypothetical protein
MSFSYNNVNSGIPTGTIIAILATIDPPGWIIANGISRTDNIIYNNLINLGIGSRNGANYNPPNLNAAFLRGVGTNTYNGITYNDDGQTINTYNSDKFQKHSHAATQVSHYHTNNTTSSTDLSRISGEKGIGVQDGTNTNANDSNYTPGQVNLGEVVDFDLNPVSPVTTIDYTGGTETSPFCYGVSWAIKI